VGSVAEVMLQESKVLALPAVRKNLPLGSGIDSVSRGGINSGPQLLVMATWLLWLAMSHYFYLMPVTITCTTTPNFH